MDFTTLVSYCSIDTILMYWRDILEIGLFYAAFYYAACWLKKDTQKNLIGYFYAYCIIIVGAYTLDLPTLTYCLFISSPIVIMLFILMHHDTLQRNFIAIKNITVTPQPSRDWLTLILRGALKTLNANTAALILIEHTDSLASYLTSDYVLDAPVTHGMIELICDEQLLNPQTMAWITSAGTVHAVHATWKNPWTTTNYSQSAAWIENALAHTTHTDALVLFLNPTNHTCSLVLKGIIHEHLSLEHAALLIRSHIKYPISPSPITQGFEYDIATQKNRMAQRTP